MNMLEVIQRTERAQIALLVLVVVQCHQGEQLLLYSHTLSNTVFLVSNEYDAENIMKDLLPNLLLLDARLSETMKSTLTHRVCHRKERRTCAMPLVAHVHMDNWQESNKEAEERSGHEALSWRLENLLVTATAEIP